MDFEKIAMEFAKNGHVQNIHFNDIHDNENVYVGSEGIKVSSESEEFGECRYIAIDRLQNESRYRTIYTRIKNASKGDAPMLCDCLQKGIADGTINLRGDSSAQVYAHLSSLFELSFTGVTFTNAASTRRLFRKE